MTFRIGILVVVVAVVLRDNAVDDRLHQPRLFAG